jgi:23S rRNA (cytosine1962-C5)-methyltransferase
MSALANRLSKNWKVRVPWARREGCTAFRIYDLDMPEYPFGIDWYDGYVHTQEFFRRNDPTADAAREALREAVTTVLEVGPERLFVKSHLAHKWGGGQYEKGAQASVITAVEEAGLEFEVNLSDYLDTGLFLDHRVLRKRVRDEARGKRVLNLFAYTGSFTVHARAGGAAETVTVDLSNTYCAWAERNLAANGFSPGPGHTVVRDDVLAWVEHARGQFDLIVLDPPPFSASKKMRAAFDVQKDHLKLLAGVRALLAPGGALYFSTNYRGFLLSPKVGDAVELDTCPKDFRVPPHRTWKLAAAATR